MICFEASYIQNKSNLFSFNSNSSSSNVGSRSSSNHLSGDMIRRLRQQQQKTQDVKIKPAATTSVACPASNNSAMRNTISHSTHPRASSSYGHSISSIPEDVGHARASPSYGHSISSIPEDVGRVSSYPRPPPLIEIESPLKGLSKLTSDGIVAPPNAVAPSSLQHNRLGHSSPYSYGSSRLSLSKMSKDQTNLVYAGAGAKSRTDYQKLEGILIGVS